MPLGGLALRLDGRDAASRDAAPMSPTLRLMVERIRDAIPGFSPGDEEEAALLDLCRRLEGNPLSIVLAAARIAMTPELARSSPDTLLDFVAIPGGRRGGRHASLEDTLEWSYRLLPSPPRVLLAELGAFAGRVSLRSLEAASSLGPDLTEALAELERTGFLRIEARSGAKIGGPMIGDSESYVARPEAVAEFSSRLLARAPFRARALEAREALYAELSEQADAEAASGGSGPASARLVLELSSLRDAVAKAAGEGNRLRAATMALAAYRTIQAEGRYAEGLALTEACLEGAGSLDEATTARLSSREAGFLFRLGRLEEAAESLYGAIAAAERLGDAAFRSELQASLAVALLELGRFEEAEASFLAAEGLAAELGDRRLALRLAVNRGLSADLRGDYEASGMRYGEAEAIARQLGDAPSLGLILKNAAARLWRLARYEESVSAYREALAESTRRYLAELSEKNQELAEYSSRLEARVAERTAELLEANTRLEVLANTDRLTGLANRRSFDEYLEREWRLCSRQGLPISMILVDVDRFKDYNDRYGHQAGDDCLARVAAAIAASPRRPSDLAARYGGEEFAVIMPGSARDGAAAVAERLLDGVRALGLRREGGTDRGVVTVSCGLASAAPTEAGESPEALIRAADEALYRAKRDGRDRMA